MSPRGLLCLVPPGALYIGAQGTRGKDDGNESEPFREIEERGKREKREQGEELSLPCELVVFKTREQLEEHPCNTDTHRYIYRGRQE